MLISLVINSTRIFQFLGIIILFTSCTSRSKPDICEVLKLESCNSSKRSLNRSAGASLPSVNAAAFNNPAAISLNRGVGIESIHYARKGSIRTYYWGLVVLELPYQTSQVMGHFFGIPAMETVNDFRERSLEGERFEQNKFILAGAFNVFGGSSKKGLQADIGIIYRRQTKLENNYYGGGLILSL